jgi:small subunit ribosomal protein S4
LARYTGPVCKQCRRETIKLFLKGDRCFTEKCAVERRTYAPGQHGQARPKVSDYAVQLREKQKVRRIYGILEKQFHGYYMKASSMKGVTGENLLQLLERRLDNVIFRLGLSGSRRESRIMVTHGHFLVNGRTVNIPSYLVKPGDTIELKEKSRPLTRFQELAAAMDRKALAPWMELDKGNMRGKILVMPGREDIGLPINENLIIELYSK